MTNMLSSLLEMYAWTSSESKVAIALIFFTAIIVLYSLFVFYLYSLLGKKNIIELNLSQYALYDHPGVARFFAVLFYIVEYLVILPILTFVGFAVLSVLILVLTDGSSIVTSLLVSAALVASVRVCSYLNKTLAFDLAKLLPFTFLAIAVTKPDFFDITALASRIAEVPNLFSDIFFYVLFILAVEIMMRLIDISVGSFHGSVEKD